jgi:phosphorylase/glycogen(starch) synthase
LIKAKADILFEISWEVCNKVGGIYTVVKSKAPLMKEYYKEYFLIGPYVEDMAKIDFEERKAPKEFLHIFKQLQSDGIFCHYGIWNITGEPSTILIDFTGAIGKKNEIKKQLWDDYKVDSISSRWEFEEPIVWSWAVSRFLEEIRDSEKKIVAHFHEWMAGSALLYLKKKNIKIATVFTTHATMLGRAIAGSGQDLYGMLKTMNPEQKAYELEVQDKFLTERACAQQSVK